MVKSSTQKIVAPVKHEVAPEHIQEPGNAVIQRILGYSRSLEVKNSVYLEKIKITTN